MTAQSTSSDRVTVAVRVRPRPGTQGVLRVGDDGSSIVAVQGDAGSCGEGGSTSESRFKFGSCFGEDATQVQVYEKVGLPMLEHALQGYNCSLLHYGQTGSGKSYSMVGPSTAADMPLESRGVLPRLCEAPIHP